MTGYQDAALHNADTAVCFAAPPSGYQMMKALRIVIGIATVMASALPAIAASVPPPGAASCSGCHAVGTTATSSVTRLYGRDANEITTAMTGFRDGSLPATVMGRIAKGFSDDELRAIAAWLAAQK